MSLCLRKAAELAGRDLDLQFVEEFPEDLGRDILLFCSSKRLLAGYLSVLTQRYQSLLEVLHVHRSLPLISGVSEGN